MTARIIAARLGQMDEFDDRLRALEALIEWLIGQTASDEEIDKFLGTILPTAQYIQAPENQGWHRLIERHLEIAKASRSRRE